MKKFLCLIISLFLILLSACSAGPIGTDHTIQLKLVYAGAELDLCAPLLREYIDEDDTAKQCDFLLEHNGENYDWQNIMLAWYGNESTEYTVYIADNPSFEDAFTAETDECEYYYGDAVLLQRRNAGGRDRKLSYNRLRSIFRVYSRF